MLLIKTIKNILDVRQLANKDKIICINSHLILVVIGILN